MSDFGAYGAEIHRILALAANGQAELPPKYALYAPYLRRIRLLRRLGFIVQVEACILGKHIDLIAHHPATNSVYIADIKAIAYKQRAINHRQLAHYASIATKFYDLPDNARLMLAIYSPECPKPNPAWRLTAAMARELVLKRYKNGGSKGRRFADLSPEQRENKRKVQRTWKAKNRDKVNADAREYNRRPDVKKKRQEYYARPDVKERHRAYYQTPERKEQARISARARHRKYREENPLPPKPPKKTPEEKRAYHREYDKRRRRENPERVRELERQKRQRQKERDPERYAARMREKQLRRKARKNRAA